MDGLGVRYVSRGVADEDVIDFDAGLAAQSDELEAFPTHRDDMAFWLYSSGSTGKPKGVVHLQHDIEITCECFAGQVLGIRSDDVIFSTTKLFHAYGLGNGLSFPLWFGATTVLMQGPTRPERIIATLAEHRPTVFCSVPGLYGAIVRHPDADGALDSVRMCVSAAEALPPQTFDRWRERFGLEIVDGIGSTEMLHIFCSNRPGEVERGTTGFPVPGYELRLTDEAGAVLEGAAVGALEVRGDSCAAFYWHQHEKTKSSMRGDWFYTGDRFERRADGAYAFVGRNDEMLKVGGLWASPIDMENVLIGHPAVGAAGVVGITVDDQSRIAAFVERAGGEMSDEQLAEELRAMCKERLRRYEYPHVVRVVDALPRTPTGKIQRFKLRDLVSQRERWQHRLSRSARAAPSRSSAPARRASTPPSSCSRAASRSTCSTSYRRRSGSCAPAWRPTTRRSRASRGCTRRPPSATASASSAASRSATTSRATSCWSATTR